MTIAIAVEDSRSAVAPSRVDLLVVVFDSSIPDNEDLVDLVLALADVESVAIEIEVEEVGSRIGVEVVEMDWGTNSAAVAAAASTKEVETTQA